MPQIPKSPWKQCNECHIMYDTTNNQDIFTHSHHKFTKCEICKKVYDAADVKEYTKHQSEVKCEACNIVYFMTNQVDVAKHASCRLCRICGRIYDALREPDHESVTHPQKRFCTPCGTVSSLTIYKNYHEGPDSSKLIQSGEYDNHQQKMTNHEKDPTPVQDDNIKLVDKNEYNPDVKIDQDDLWRRIAKFYADGEPETATLKGEVPQLPPLPAGYGNRTTINPPQNNTAHNTTIVNGNIVKSGGNGFNPKVHKLKVKAIVNGNTKPVDEYEIDETTKAMWLYDCLCLEYEVDENTHKAHLIYAGLKIDMNQILCHLVVPNGVVHFAVIKKMNPPVA